MRLPSLRPLAALAITALLVWASVGTVHAAPPPRAVVILGFEGPIDNTTLALLGGTVVKRHERLSLVGLQVPDASAFVAMAAKNPRIAFAETNDPVRAVGTGWDATGWDGTSWDGTGWDGTGWDGTGWDGTGWDGTGWDGTGWDGTGWDGTGWDGTGWDGTGWDGTGWDGTGWDGTGWDGTGWDGLNYTGTGWDGTGWDGTGWDGTGWDGTGWDGTGWDGTGWDGTGWDGTGWDGSIWNSSYLAARSSGGGGGDPMTRFEWGWHTINARQAIKIAGGEGANLCVIDSGVDATHPDLAASMWRDASGSTGIDYVNGDNDPMDDGGHGTHVAGIAAAANRNGIGIAGAGAGKIMAAKVLDANGTGNELNLALAIDWCVTNGARVLSLSLSTDQDSPAVRRAVQDATARGAILVAAAGNTGASGAPRYPAAYPEVIAVGATMPDGRWAPYSTAASYVDIAAPGWAIASTYKGGGYAAINGTSMATPFVSATVSLMLKVNPAMNTTDAKAALARSAIDLGPPGPDEYTGFGFLRADRATVLAHER